jgi:hypothetical protein
MPIMPHGELMVPHFPLAYIDNNPPARLSEWIGAPCQSCKQHAQPCGNAISFMFINFPRLLRHIPH